MFIHRELQHHGREMSCRECSLIGLLKQLDYIYFDVQPRTRELGQAYDDCTARLQRTIFWELRRSFFLERFQTLFHFNAGEAEHFERS